MFSPYYAAARRRGPARPEAHAAINVALYRPGGKRWVMSERAAPERSERSAALGGSSIEWSGDALELRFDERCATFPSPVPARLRGSARIWPRALDGRPVALAPGHVWSPIAPSARAELRLEDPALRFTGEAYLDANRGIEGLEDGFLGWHWSRLAAPEGTIVSYHATPRAGAPLALSRRYDRRGGVRELEAGSLVELPRTRWGIERRAALAPGARVIETLEDTPFYARSLLGGELAGVSGLVMHESLDAARFSRRWVQFLLPFRMHRGRS